MRCRYTFQELCPSIMLTSNFLGSVPEASWVSLMHAPRHYITYLKDFQMEESSKMLTTSAFK